MGERVVVGVEPRPGIGVWRGGEMGALGAKEVVGLNGGCGDGWCRGSGRGRGRAGAGHGGLAVLHGGGGGVDASGGRGVVVVVVVGGDGDGE